jgi:hypothetical protein
MTSTTMTQRELKMTAEKEVKSLQAEIDRLNELNQILLDQLFDHGQPCGPIEDYIEMNDGTHHDAYRIFGRNDYLEYINDKSSFSTHPDGALSKFQVICRKWLVRRDLSPDIFEADTEEEEEVEDIVERIEEDDEDEVIRYYMNDKVTDSDIEKRFPNFHTSGNCYAVHYRHGYTCVIYNRTHEEKVERIEEKVEEEEVEDPLEAKIDKMTVKQLKAFCKDNTIKNYTKLKKAELKLHIQKAMRDYKECIVGDYTTKKQHDEIGSYLSGLLSNIPNH